MLRLRKAVYGFINAPLRWHQRLSRALRQAGFVSLQTDPCVWILPAPCLVKSVSSVDVPIKLRTAVADSSVSLTTEIRMDLWKRQRNFQGVLEVHVDDLVGGRNLTFQNAVQWLRTRLEFGNLGSKSILISWSRIESRVPSTLHQRSPCRSFFKTWSPLLFPNMRKPIWTRRERVTTCESVVVRWMLPCR